MSAAHLIKLAKRWGTELKCREGPERELIHCFLSDLLTEIHKVQQHDSESRKTWMELGKKEGFVAQSDEEKQVKVATLEKFLQLTGRQLENEVAERF
jgi:hypothetical protein